jgi:hypothetical protein
MYDTIYSHMTERCIGPTVRGYCKSAYNGSCIHKTGNKHFVCTTVYCQYVTFHILIFEIIQNGSKLLSGFTWPINGNSDNNLESPCISNTKLWSESFTIEKTQLTHFGYYNK